MVTPDQALSVVPTGLRAPLFACYKEILRNFAERRWEPAELNGGKFCEVIFSILEGALSGKFPPSPKKPRSMVDACRALEGTPPDPVRAGDRSLRVLIPRTLPVLYEIRNNRGVGHVGGDVDPNYQDSVAVVQMSSWIMAELIRIFYRTTLAEAETIVNTLVERKHPIVWKEGELRRVLDTSLPKSDQSLLLLYSSEGWTDEKDLHHWVEYTNLSLFRNRIILPLHDARILEYDKKTRKLKLTPKGVDDVEKRLLARYAI